MSVGPSKIGTFLAAFVVLGGAHCKRDSGSAKESPGPAAKGVATPAASSSPAARPLELGPLRPLPGPEPSAPAVVPASFKSNGAINDLLESELYSFKVISFRACNAKSASQAAPQPAKDEEPVTFGAEVEITAKSKLAISPRDVVLKSGGILFYASLDLSRKVADCTPLIERPRLKERETAKGFVLFDVPAPVPKNLELVYQPTRWGGADAVQVQLPR